MKISIDSADDIALAGEVAAALEACGWPKPGNVHRTADFPDTTFEHFITGSIALGPALRLAASRGMKAGSRRLPYDSIGVGGLIQQAVSNVKRWHHGGNTHLGISMLFIPLVAAAGATLSSMGAIEPSDLRRSVMRVMGFTTPMDAVKLYEVVKMVGGGWWGRLYSKEGPPDLNDPDAEKKIIEGGFNLLQVMKYSAPWDNIAGEWATGMKMTFQVGYPTFTDTYSKHQNVNIATVHTFLTILSKKPDTFIARKYGLEKDPNIRTAFQTGMSKAKEVSKKAQEMLKLGGLLTNEGRRALFQMDEELRSQGSELNPGSTADMTASSILIALLAGFRP